MADHAQCAAKKVFQRESNRKPNHNTRMAIQRARLWSERYHKITVNKMPRLKRATGCRLSNMKITNTVNKRTVMSNNILRRNGILAMMSHLMDFECTPNS